MLWCHYLEGDTEENQAMCVFFLLRMPFLLRHLHVVYNTKPANNTFCRVLPPTTNDNRVHPERQLAVRDSVMYVHIFAIEVAVYACDSSLRPTQVIWGHWV